MWRLGWIAYLRGDVEGRGGAVGAAGGGAGRPHVPSRGALLARARDGAPARPRRRRAALRHGARPRRRAATTACWPRGASRRAPEATRAGASARAAGESGRRGRRRSGLRARRSAAAHRARRVRAGRSWRTSCARAVGDTVRLYGVLERLRARRALPHGAADLRAATSRAGRLRRSGAAARVLGDALPVRLAQRGRRGRAARRTRSVPGGGGRAGGVELLSRAPSRGRARAASCS